MTTVDTVSTATPRSARFWDRIAERYAKKPVADEASYQRKLQITRSYLRPDMDVMEFGCGTGSTALVLAPDVARITAIDISSKMIGIARGKAKSAGVANVTFVRAAMDEFDAPAERFDAVLGMSILHLLEDRDAAIAKVHGLLKPGGVFVTSTACLGDFMRSFKLIGPIGRFLGLLPLVKVFTSVDLENSLTAQGFRIIERWQPGKARGVFIVAVKAG
ncbi:class I SAM-dependent methyltransferase [Thalassobaculum sp.]|uniref:class I SAM-dependent methyltransferase n=1 Tax=Thalassobaculum sp. TaxID=2022740 RepID=UPI0032ECEAD5